MAITVYERDVLTLAIALVEDTDPRLHVPALVREGHKTGLSSECLAAVERVFSRGLARRLARGGATRLWEQAPPLRFGSASLDLLHWLHTTPISHTKTPALRLRSKPTVVETLLFARAVDLIEAAGVRQLPEPFFEVPWLWMFRGEQLAVHQEPSVSLVERLDSEDWLIIACHRELRGIWARWSRRARAESVPNTVRHGTVQAGLAEAIVNSSADKPERVAFLIDLVTLLADLPHEVWEVNRGRATLSMWQRARQARVAMLRVMTEQVGRWRDVWRATGFLDDAYEQTQLWLRRYEPGLRALNLLRHPVERARQLPEVA
ncbi:MAG: hypothetical protein AAGA48_29720 [Myxococcota bacterium]